MFTAIGVIFYLLFVVSKCAREPFMPGNEVSIELDFEDINKKVFLRAKVWGISSNHSEIVLSEKQNAPTNKQTDFVFYTSEAFYKIEGNGLLTIYAPKNLTNKPKQEWTSIKVVLRDLKNYDSLTFYNKNYQKLGLERISVYDGL